MDMLRTHYDNLQVKETASPEVIKGAYRYLSQKWHPDKHPGDKARAERTLKIINRAYEVLSDPEQRRTHDEWIAAMRDRAEPAVAPAVETPQESHQSQPAPPPTPADNAPMSPAGTWRDDIKSFIDLAPYAPILAFYLSHRIERGDGAPWAELLGLTLGPSIGTYAVAGLAAAADRVLRGETSKPMKVFTVTAWAFCSFVLWRHWSAL
jgi:hypothetical protein